MGSNHRQTPSAPTRPRWRQFIDFLVRRRARIFCTIVLALAVDYAGGRLLQHDLSQVQDSKALFGLVIVLTGMTLLAWTAGCNSERFRLPVNPTLSFLEDPRISALIISLIGLGLLIDEPKNIWLVLGPVILLDLVRLGRQELEAPHWVGSRRSSLLQDFGRRPRGIIPILIVPLATLLVVGYASPLVSLHFHEVCEIFCLLLSFVGLAIRMLAAGYLSAEPTNDASPPRCRKTLFTDGIFSIVRYPRYLGDYFIGLGVVLIPFVWWLPVLYSLAFWLYYKHIIANEDEVARRKFGRRFDEWAAATPALIPRVSRWRPARTPFSFRTALRREHTALLLVVALHSSVEWLEHLVLERRIMLEVFWIVITVTGLAVYLVVRQLEKHTRLLNVPAQ